MKLPGLTPAVSLRLELRAESFSLLLRLPAGKAGRERNPSEAKSDLAKGDKVHAPQRPQYFGFNKDWLIDMYK